MARSVVTFDAGSSLLKMAVFSVDRNRIQLTDFDVSPMSVPEEAPLEERNRVLARQMKASLALKKIKSTNILVSMSGQSAFTRFVKLPAVEEAKVSQIIKYEAQQQVPFPIEDVEWDHFIIGKTPTGEIDIVLVAMKSDVIASFIHECGKAGLDVEAVDVAPLSLYNCLRYAEEQSAECTAALDFGAGALNLVISEGDDLWARTILIGGESITAGIAKELNVDRAEAEKLKQAAWVPGPSGWEPPDATDQQRKAARVIGSFIDRVFAELSRSIGFYRSQPGHSPIKRILLCGGSSRLRNLREFLSERFKVDVGTLLPLKRVTVAPSVSREQLNQVSDLFAGVVGLGLRDAEMGRIRVNLLPKSIARQKELSKKKVLIIAAGWLLVASLLLLAFQKKLAHGDNSSAFNNLVTSIRKTAGGIIPTGPTLKEELEKLKALTDKDSEMASKISVIEGDIDKVERKIDAIGEIQQARLYWAQFIEDLKSIKTEVAGRGQRNHIWLTYVRITESSLVMSEHMPVTEGTGDSMYLSDTYRVSAHSRTTTSTRKKGVDTRPWVVIKGYVKIPTGMRGEERETARRVETFMKALETMGQTFLCQREHRYREDKETGYLYPVSADTGPARAYRYRWDDAAKELVLEGRVQAEASEENQGDSAPSEEWKELGRQRARKKPDWLTDEGRIKAGEDVSVPCPIGLAEGGSRARARNCTRTAGYLDEVDVRWLQARSEKVAWFTIFARFADEFVYPGKSEML